MAHQLLVYLDDVNLLLLTVKKNKEALVVAGVEGGNDAERSKVMFMSFEQCEGQSHSLKNVREVLKSVEILNIFGKDTNKQVLQARRI
jgi:hypothetical protein